MPLTRCQANLMAYLVEYFGEHGYMPAFWEIAQKFGYKSLSTVHEHLGNMERKGYIRRNYGEERSIEIVHLDALHDRDIERERYAKICDARAVEACGFSARMADHESKTWWAGAASAAASCANAIRTAQALP